MRTRPEIRALIQQRFGQPAAERLPVIVDIPLKPVRKAPQQEAIQPEQLKYRCVRTSPSGRVCGRPEFEDTGECLAHYRWNQLLPATVPYPNDMDALRESMARVLSLLLAKQVTPQQASAAAKLGAVIQRSLEWEEVHG